MRSSARRPERTPRPSRLHRPSRRQSRGGLTRVDPARGDMVIGAFVLARLLGLRLLTLEAQVVVHDDDRDAAGSGPLVMTQLAPDRPALSPARPERPVPPGRGTRLSHRSPRDGPLRPEHPVGPDRPDRPVPPGWLGLASGGSDLLARAAQLVEQGSDTVERTRRGQYRG